MYVPPLSSVLALLLALAGAPAATPVPQDPTDWRVETSQGTRVVRETAARGFGALPLSTLVALGAEVSYTPDGATARLGARELRFRIGSAEVVTPAGGLRLEHAVYEDDGVLYLPAEFFRVHLPVLGPPIVAVDAATQTIRRGAVVVREEARRPANGVASSLQWTEPEPLRRVELTENGSVVPVRAASAAPSVTSVPARPTVGSPSPDITAGGIDGVTEEDGDTLPGSRARAARPRRGNAARSAAGRRLVVVDAGHGGRDPGARGPSGVREKDVTLSVARRLAEILRRDPTLEVRMTRDRDTLIALRDRTRLANGWKNEGQPALFLSIHANANPSSAARGFETYFLSEAKTADAKRVEAMENAAQEFEDDDSGRMNPLDFIFHDLRQNQYLRESSDWAEMIQEKLGEVHPGPDRGVKQAGFFVLNGAFMPAVLVEIGFITNRGEEQTLATPARQQAIAQQLAESVRAYFDRAAPVPRRVATGSRD